MSDLKWIEWARALHALSQTGMHYAVNEYDKERYKHIGDIAADMLASHSSLTRDQALQLNAAEFGYATPKVDVRGVAFRDDRVLLVQEILDENRWTLPGGWADVNETPSGAVVREVAEESGFETRVTRLLACYDRDEQGHKPPYPHHVYKLFFLCEITGGCAETDHETSGVDFFAEDELPELSQGRVTEDQLHRFFKWHREDRERPADFD